MMKNKFFTAVYAQRSPIIVGVIAVLCLSFFINKPFHIDDPLFIWSAKQIQINPLNFYGFSVNWYGFDAPMSKITQNPPLACYYIALVSLFFGFSEIVLHIAFLLPAVATALGTYYLAKFFCSRPALAALAAVLTPCFLVSSSNIMCDTMMLAFWLWAVLLWNRGLEKDSFIKLFFAALLIAVCSLTKYFGMALLPLLFIYSIVKKRRLGLWILFFLLPVIILAAYQLATHKLYGYGLLSNAAKYATNFNSRQGWKWLLNILTGLFFTGGCIASAFFFIPVLWSKRFMFIGAILTLLFILLLAGFNFENKFYIKDRDFAKLLFLVQAGLMAAAGCNILWLVFADLWKSRNAESLLLFLWIMGTFSFSVFINWSINARTLLPMIPAVGILLIRRLDRRFAAMKLTKIRLFAWPLIPSAALAIMVCWADYSWAASVHLAADSICKSLQDGRRTVWFEGHWGFQYYMQANGAPSLDYNNRRFVSGDVIVIPSNNTNMLLFPKDIVEPYDMFEFVQFRNLATMNMKLGTGFYTDMWGALPFAVGLVDPEKYYIFIVK